MTNDEIEKILDAELALLDEIISKNAEVISYEKVRLDFLVKTRNAVDHVREWILSTEDQDVKDVYMLPD